MSYDDKLITGARLNYFWQQLKNKFPSKSTTLAGYGITDAYTKEEVKQLVGSGSPTGSARGVTIDYHTATLQDVRNACSAYIAGIPVVVKYHDSVRGAMQMSVGMGTYIDNGFLLNVHVLINSTTALSGTLGHANGAIIRRAAEIPLGGNSTSSGIVIDYDTATLEEVKNACSAYVAGIPVVVKYRIGNGTLDIIYLSVDAGTYMSNGYVLTAHAIDGTKVLSGVLGHDDGVIIRQVEELSLGGGRVLDFDNATADDIMNAGRAYKSGTPVFINTSGGYYATVGYCFVGTNHCDLFGQVTGLSDGIPFTIALQLSCDNGEVTYRNTDIIPLGGSAVNPDYNENDETSKAYIQNRPFYEASQEITLEKTSESPAIRQDVNGNFADYKEYCRVSDKPIDKVDLIGAVLYGSFSHDGSDGSYNNELEETITEDDIVELNYEDAVGGFYTAGAYVVTNYQAINHHENIPFDSNGVYLIKTCSEGGFYGETTEYTKLSFTRTVIEKLDNKYLDLPNNEDFKALNDSMKALSEGIETALDAIITKQNSLIGGDS